MRILLDTSCLVAAALPQHEHHGATLADLARRRTAGDEFVMATHAVLEAYAVLTRLPPPHRLAPADAMAVLDRNWGHAATQALTAGDTWRLLRRQGAAGIAGGRIFDAAIAAAARKAGAEELLTWNLRHFAGLDGPRAVAPAGG